MATVINTLTAAINNMANKKIQSAKRSTRCMRRTFRVRSAQYDNVHEMRNINESADKRSSAIVSFSRMVMTIRISPITVRQTPTMAAETVKMWMHRSSSSVIFVFDSDMITNAGKYAVNPTGLSKEDFHRGL